MAIDSKKGGAYEWPGNYEKNVMGVLGKTQTKLEILRLTQKQFSFGLLAVPSVTGKGLVCVLAPLFALTFMALWKILGFSSRDQFKYMGPPRWVANPGVQ